MVVICLVGEMLVNLFYSTYVSDRVLVPLAGHLSLCRSIRPYFLVIRRFGKPWYPVPQPVSHPWRVSMDRSSHRYIPRRARFRVFCPTLFPILDLAGRNLTWSMIGKFQGSWFWNVASNRDMFSNCDKATFGPFNVTHRCQSNQ